MRIRALKVKSLRAIRSYPYRKKHAPKVIISRHRSAGLIEADSKPVADVMSSNSGIRCQVAWFFDVPFGTRKTGFYIVRLNNDQ